MTYAPPPLPDDGRLGMPPEEARLAARRAFGGVARAKDAHRDARSFVWIDDARRECGERIDLFLRLAVRQRDKKHVARRYLVRRSELQFRSPTQIGVNVVKILADMRLGRDLRQFDLWMRKQNAREFAARVTGTTNNGSFDH